jgi:hypothetical protein
MSWVKEDELLLFMAIVLLLQLSIIVGFSGL